MSKNKIKPNAEGKFEGFIIRYWIKEAGEDYGKSYIIHSTNLKDRMRLWKQKGASIGGKKIMEARERYDPKNDWQYEHLEKVTMGSPQELMEELKKRHTFYIDHFDSINNGYNTSHGGTGNKDVEFSDKWKEKISKNHRDSQTEEAKKKISEANLGKIVSEETKAKISAGLKGKPKSDAAKQAMSACRKGKEPKAASAGAALWRANNDPWWKTHKITDKMRANMKAAQQARGRRIKAISETGEICVFPTMLDAAKYFGLGVGSIHYALKTRNILKSCTNRFEEISETEYLQLLPLNPNP